MTLREAIERDHEDAASVDKGRFIGICEWDLCRVVTLKIGSLVRANTVEEIRVNET